MDQKHIDTVRAHTKLSALVRRRGVRLDAVGRSRKGLCPFCKEKNPSFHVSEERGFYHCFGCGAHGDAFRWVMETQGKTYVDAIKQLARNARRRGMNG